MLVFRKSEDPPPSREGMLAVGNASWAFAFLQASIKGQVGQATPTCESAWWLQEPMVQHGPQTHLEKQGFV